MPASIFFEPKTLSEFRENQTKEEEYKTENKLVFLALHALGKQALRVSTDGVRITWHYVKDEVFTEVNRVMTSLTNGSSDEQAYKVDISRLLVGWTVWETYLNQMRDLTRANRFSRQ